MRISKVVMGLGAAVVIGGCGADSGNSPLEFQEWELAEMWRVGGTEDVALGLVLVRDLDMLPDGRLVVLEAMGPKLMFFDTSAGKSVGSFGRKGNGPDEFMDVTGVALAPSGELVVADFGNGRFAVVSTEGEVIRTVRAPRPAWGTKWRGRFDSSGALLDPGYPVVGASGVRREGWLKRNGDLSIADSVPVPPCEDGEPPPNAGTIPLITRPDRGLSATITGATPLIPRVVTVDGFEWAPREFGKGVLARRAIGSCTVLAEATLVGERAKIPEAERSATLQGVRDYARRVEAVLPDLKDSVIPTERPWYTGLYTDSESRLWVHRMVPGESRFDVFNPDGEQVAIVRLGSGPHAGYPAVVTGERFYGFESDQDGGAYLVAYRIVVRDGAGQ